ncbi:MAG: hypothetical protein RI564_11845 [Gracilimonas sp.]|nr:hypothetical protein [Gracilimonas sp.]
MYSRIGITLVSVFLLVTTLSAQDNGKVDYSGNLRLAYVSSTDDAINHFEGTTFLRIRLGAFYTFNANNGFKARLATTQSSKLPKPKFTVLADGGGLNRGSISFDEFYYQFQNDVTQIKAGRFRYYPKILSNAERSHFRFMSNNVNVHWLDGVYIKRDLNEEWFTELVGEYQPRNQTSVPYRGNLNFGNNEHNFASYLGVDNRTRDKNNIIQKGFGLFVAPDAYLKSGSYSTYLAVMSRMVYDLPRPDILKGGSFRIAAEVGQNLNSPFENGTNAVISFGVNGFAEKHRLMAEFAKTDAEWLTPNVYVPNADELEFRYHFIMSDNMKIEARYRIRDYRTNRATNYNFFARFTYSF